MDLSLPCIIMTKCSVLILMIFDFSAIFYSKGETCSIRFISIFLLFFGEIVCFIFYFHAVRFLFRSLQI